MQKKFNGHANKGGVYKITNLKDEKVYIGSAKTFKTRAAGHSSSLKNNKHQNKHLQASWNKHGADAFLFEVIEVVPGNKTARTTREQFYIDQWKDRWEQCFNFKKKTVEKDRSCWSKSPEKTRKKMSESMKKKWKDPEYRKFQSEFQSEKTKELWQDPEYRARHVEAIREFTQKPEYRKKLSRAAQGKEVPEKTRKKISRSVSKVNKELWQSPEYRKKVIEGRKRSWAKDDARKKRASERLCKLKQKTYKLRNPEGVVVAITNMQKFCEKSEVTLVPQLMSKVARGLRKSYKGWSAV